MSNPSHEIALALLDISAGFGRLARALLTEPEKADALVPLLKLNAGAGNPPAVQSEGAGNQTSDAEPAPVTGHEGGQSGGFATAPEAGSPASGPEPVADPPEPPRPPPHTTKFEKVMEAYALEPPLTEWQIACRIPTSQGTVCAYLNKARKAKDPRVAKGDMLRRIHGPEPSKPRPIGASSPPPKANPTPPQPLEPSASPVVEALEPLQIAYGDVLSADIGTRMVSGPGGTLPFSVPLVRALRHMRKGEAFELKALKDISGCSSVETMRHILMDAAPALERIGIDMVKVGPEMFRVRVAAE